jgi:hypothetical protein
MRVKLKEMDAARAMVATYNHEINNALRIAVGWLGRLKSDNEQKPAFKKVSAALERIGGIVQKIKAATLLNELPTENYTNNSKMVKL